MSRKTVYREIDRGALPALHVGRQLRIDPDDFRHYLTRERGSGMTRGANPNRPIARTGKDCAGSGFS